jgi:cell division septation protein DedD
VPTRGTKPADDSTQPSSQMGGPRELTPDQEDEVRRLSARDRSVRAHEAAHQAAAGAAGGGATFSYVTGPDGRQYAVGGEVPVQLSAGRTPEETIRNAQRVRAAALAPADPSTQDRAVASEAAALEAAARDQIASRRLKSSQPATSQGSPAAESSSLADNLNTADAFSLQLATLQSERLAANGGYSHLHSEPCAICAAAVAKYS